MVYQCHYPTRSMQTARGAKKSAIYDRLAARGAYFRDVSGWEGADWYAPEGTEPKVEEYSWGRQSWFDVLASRAPGHARRRDPDGHVVHGEVSGAGQGRGPDPEPRFGQRRGRRRRLHHVHTVAERSGQARSGSHRHQARRRRVLRDRFGYRAPPRAHLAFPAHPWRRACVRQRRDFRLRADQRSGSAFARVDAIGDERRSVEPGLPISRGARDRHRLCARALHSDHVSR